MVSEELADATADALQPVTSLHKFAPQDFHPVGPTERFSPQTAFEKIDGKIEFYSPLGFRALQCQRFASQTNPADMFEMFVYHMATPDGAFAALTLQRRETAQPSDITPFSYSSENMLAFMHNNLYVELLAAGTSAAVLAAMENTARRFVSNQPEQAKAPLETSWFPPENLKPETITLTLQNGFGFEGFTRLFSALYSTSNSDLQAFFNPTQTAGHALNLFTGYSSFLIDNGAVFESALPDIPGGRAYNVFGTYELLFVAGPVMGGVHQADDIEAARATAKALYTHLMKLQEE